MVKSKQFEIFWKGKVMGPFSEGEVQELLRSGKVGLWTEIRELEEEWSTLESWLKKVGGDSASRKPRRRRNREGDSKGAKVTKSADAINSGPRLKKKPDKADRSGIESEIPLSEKMDSVSVVCFKGPDFGKNLVLDSEKSNGSVGRNSGDPVKSDDPAFARGSILFQLNNDQSISFQSVDGPECYLEGVPVMSGAMQTGQQLRMGGSYWMIRRKKDSETVESSPEKSGGLLDSLSSNVSRMAGVDKIEGFQLGEVMKEVFSRHSPNQLERKFVCGTPETTPRLDQIETAWPKPWLFVRMFFLSALICVGFAYGLERFQNFYLIPGFLFIASFGVPISTLILFWEAHILRNVSFYQVTRLVFAGGTLAIIGSLTLSDLSSFDEMIGPPSAGVIEEVGKIAALVLLMGSQTRYQWTLNGMLFGASVGCGFASFETAGYILLAFLAEGDLYSLAFLRGVLSPFTHIIWTAAAAAALWRVKGEEKFSFWMLFDLRFVRVLVLVALLHAIWNFNPGIYFFDDMMAEYLFLGLNGLVGWLLVLALYQSGLKEIQAAKLNLND